MASAIFRSPDGTRRVQIISLDGHLYVQVTDPRGTHQAKNTLVARIPMHVQGDRLAPDTMARLREAGVNLASMVEIA